MNKYDEALSRIKKGYADYQAGKTHAVLISEHHESDLNIAIEALQAMSQLTEARKKFEEAELELRRASLDELMTIAHRKADDKYHSAKLKFYETCANLTREE